MTRVPPRLLAAVAAVLAHPRQPAAAAALGISARTLRRWCALPAFKAALDAERRRLLAAATDGLRQAGVEAVSSLRAILADPETPNAVKVQAAGCILGHLFRAVEISDVVERIDALEEAQANAKSHN